MLSACARRSLAVALTGVLVALAGLALTALDAPLAQAQSTPSSVTLVNNIGHTTTTVTHNTHDGAQAFTTGNHADGYTITSLTLDLDVTRSEANDLADYEVEIYRTDSNGRSTTRIATLQKPSALVHGANTFNASGSGVSLAANTTYAVLWNVTARR